MTNGDPRLSVVLPAYNAEDTLNTAVESIVGQTESDLQLIIVDDGSTDATPRLIRDWQRKDNRITALFEEHKGIAAALNRGLREAEAPYVARMDADDYSQPERLEKQADFLDIHDDIGVVSCLVEHWSDASGEQEGYAHYVKWINSLTESEEIAVNRFIESPLAHPSVMFRRELIEQHGGYRQGAFPEDYELWLRWLSQGVRIRKIPEVLFRWRDREQRLSRTHERYSTEAFYRLKAQYLSQWLEEHNPAHPEVIVWGAGKTSRARADYLTRYGIRISAYIDVDPNKVGNIIDGRPVFGYKELPLQRPSFIVSYVGLRSVNSEIRDILESNGYELKKDFIFAA